MIARSTVQEAEKEFNQILIQLNCSEREFTLNFF